MLHTINKIICSRLYTINYTLLNKIQQHMHVSAKECTIVSEKDGNITLIGINCEHKRNSIDASTGQQLKQAISVFEADAASPVGVLYGLGAGSFCAGYDLADIEAQLKENTRNILLNVEGNVGPTRRQLKKPLIAAINGYCVAQGVELALMCDLRVMDESAIIGFYNRKMGIPLTDAGTVRLSAAIGLSHALDIIMTGRRVSAAEALRIGLINRIVATGTSLGQAVHLAFCISKFMQPQLQQDRQVLLDNTYTKDGLQAAMQRELRHMTGNVLQQIRQNAKSYKSSSVKNNRTDGWSITDKQYPDWEKPEIAYEQANLSKLCKT